MNRTIKLLTSQKINGKRQTVELFPEDEISANDETIMVAFLIEHSQTYVIIPDATVEQVWEEWEAQF